MSTSQKAAGLLFGAILGGFVSVGAYDVSIRNKAQRDLDGTYGGVVALVAGTVGGGVIGYKLTSVLFGQTAA
jgi:hypothetical protein